MTNESILDPALDAKLRRMRLRPQLDGPDTLKIRNVPANQRCFNKAQTNVLIKRSTERMPCLVCLDEDLEYTGQDQALVKSFAAAPAQQGWRVLTFSGEIRGDLTSALEYALDILGAEGESAETSEVSIPTESKLLATWARSLTKAIANNRAGSSMFRGEEIEQVAACTLSWQGRLPLVLGDAGTGKTNLLHGVANLLSLRDREVLMVNMGAMMAGTLFESEREALLTSLLREARISGAVLALEQAEWAIIGVPRSIVLLREALDQGARMIATSAAEHEQRFATHPLGSRLEIVRLQELCANDTRSVLEVLRRSIATHHGVQIDTEVEHAAVERSLSMSGYLPGKAIKLLDSAAARASLIGAVNVTLLDVYIAASRMEERV